MSMKYWKDNAPKLKGQPQDYAEFKQAVADHRAALRYVDVEDAEIKHEAA